MSIPITPTPQPGHAASLGRPMQAGPQGTDTGSIIVALERCMSAPSQEEVQLLADIRLLTFYEVDRLPAADLAAGGMQPHQCHNNAVVHAGRDATHESRMISGWWRRGGCFLFHSVILSRTQLWCVTPHADEPPIIFAPDFDIDWRETDRGVVAQRRGRAVPFLVRDDPASVIATAQAARDALLAGADPASARLPF